jgi:hypothetical protein
MVEMYGKDIPVDVMFGLVQAERFDSAKDNETLHAVVGTQVTLYV